MTLLDEYEKYHTARTDAELNFGRILFLQELGGILGPKCYNNLSGRTNHNSYVSLIGPSSRSRKTTVQDLVKDLTEDDWRHPDEMSPEQLLVELVDNPQNFWFYGEWSKILKRIDTNHYLSDIAEITNVIFTCPKKYIKKLRGKDGKGEKFEIEYPYLCFNTTCTEEVLLKHLDEEMTHGGYLARFIIVKGGSQGGKRKIVSGEDRKHYGRLKRILNHMWTLKQFHKVLIFQLTEDARDRHYQIEKEMYKIEGVEAFAGRYGGYLASFADILMVSDKLGKYIDKPDEFEKIKSVTELFNIQMIEGEPIIFVDTEYIDRAWEILKPHLKYLSLIHI